jgi:hypothetical protein
VLTIGSDSGPAHRSIHTIIDKKPQPTIVDAKYGALGVLDETGTASVRFHHRGHRTMRVSQAIGTSSGRATAILGLLIVDPKPLSTCGPAPENILEPLRLPTDINPSMTSFLGVPIAVRWEGVRPIGKPVRSKGRR